MFNQFQSMLKVVTIGGGGGHAAVVQALRDLPVELTALCNTVDDGGSSGQLMRDYGVRHPGEVRRVLAALAADGESLNFRFGDGTLGGQVVGNVLLSGLELSTGSLQTAIDRVRRYLGSAHQVAPITENNPVLHARTRSGLEVVGQVKVVAHLAANPQDTIVSLWVDPASSPLSAIARQALIAADVIIVAMGDLYSSIAPSFCLTELQGLWPRLKAKVVWLPNVVARNGHTHYESTTKALQFFQSICPAFQPHVVVAHQGEISESGRMQLLARGYFVSRFDLVDSRVTVVKEDLLGERPLLLPGKSDPIERSPIDYDLIKLRAIFNRLLL